MASGSKAGRKDLSPVQQALLSVREMKAKLAEGERVRNEPIAVIGLGCRFPGGADDPQQFWRLLCEGFDGISEVPSDRWDVDAYYDADPDAAGKINTRNGGYLGSVDRFDADFFGISPREASSMDPQQRLLLEVSWEALENAGQDPSALAASQTGVFFGLGSSDYIQLFGKQCELEDIDAYLGTGNAHAVATGRLSYFLGLEGPSVTVDTACSGSLASVHVACQSLHLEECRLALAGGVNLILMPDIGVALTKAHMLSADGRCRAFDAAASGFSRAEGCGVVVLKRLSHAIEDRDRILAVIRGSAINQDGRSNGLTAPKGSSQEAVLRAALARGNVDPAEVDYVEAHGTGTSLGDPIEAQALGAVMSTGRPADRPLAIGSVKTNIGHLESAAGIAGFIKAVLAIHHGVIPPHLHLNQPNPLIPWTKLPLVVPTVCTPWPREKGKRLAGVSSFGFSGTNVHVVLGDVSPTQPTEPTPERPLHILTISAKTETALASLVDSYAAHLESTPASSLEDVCFTANAGRAHLDHRVALVGASPDEFVSRLRAFAAGEAARGVVGGRIESADAPEVAFLFTGQGSQYAGMGRQLYETEPVFRDALTRCAELLEGQLDAPLLPTLYPPDGGVTQLDETAITQPALFALEFALAELWRSWGIVPTAVLGHSVGEYAAACIAGVFSLEDGLRLIAARGRLMQAMAAGSMAAVFASESRVQEAIDAHADTLSLAAVNGPEEVVISGETATVEEMLAGFLADGIQGKQLRVSHAFHSPLMEPMLDAFDEVLRDIEMRIPRLALVSNVTGRVEGEAATDPAYWRRHVLAPVRFSQGLQSLQDMDYRVFVEIGPHPTLLGLASKCPRAEAASWLPSLRRNQNDLAQMLDSLARLHTVGVEIDWDGLYREPHRRRVALPSYPFERQRYWLQTGKASGGDLDPTARWELVSSSAERAAGMVPIDLGVHTYGAKMEQLDRLAAAYMEKALHDLGAFRTGGGVHTDGELLETLGIQPTYRHLLHNWLEHLAATGRLERRDEGFACRRPLSGDSLDDVHPDAVAALADVPFLLEYVDRCGAMLTEVLTGRESALETLFPGGSTESAEAIYRHWAVARYFNNIARSAVESLARAVPAPTTLRLLEIGAGTGSTTESLLPVLPAERTVYWFTDASEFFLPKAAATFEAYPFVRYGVLDIEASPSEQGYGTGQFDAVVAANVLHATRDLAKTLAHVASVLAPGGLLVLLETTRHPSWFDITTGLIEGWQQFEDDIRRDNPLVTSERWLEVIRAAGFAEARAYPGVGSPAEVLPNHVILASMPADAVATGTGEGREATAVSRVATVAVRPAADDSLLSELRDAPPGDRQRLLADWVRDHLMRTLGRERERLIGHHERFFDLGMDSLMAVEFRSALSSGLGLDQPLPATLAFDHPTVEEIARYLVETMFPDGADSFAAEPDAGGHDDAGESAESVDASLLQGMSDEEVEELLNRKLEGL